MEIKINIEMLASSFVKLINAAGVHPVGAAIVATTAVICFSIWMWRKG